MRTFVSIDEAAKRFSVSEPKYLSAARLCSQAILVSALIAWAAPASASCVTSDLNDTCFVDASTDQSAPVDAKAGFDTIELGGGVDFSFSSFNYLNFESLEKTGSNNVTLADANSVTGGLRVRSGSLTLLNQRTAFGGSAPVINDTSRVTIDSGAAIYMSGGGGEAVGSLSGSGTIQFIQSYITYVDFTRCSIFRPQPGCERFINIPISSDAVALVVGLDNTSTTFSGSILGPGSVVKNGSGTLTLSGANSYSGTTTVQSGVLLLFGGAALPDTSQVTIAGGATLAVGANEAIASIGGEGSVSLLASTLTILDAGSFSGSVSGSGGIAKAGNGTLTLSGSNSFSGSTSISGGALVASGGAAIGDASSVSVAQGAILSLEANETVGSIAGTGAINLNKYLLTVGGNKSSTEFSGTISGLGQLTKEGSGTLTLSGANTFTGPINVNAGTLLLQGGSAIPDTSSITVAAGATIALGGTETIANLSGSGLLFLGASSVTLGNGSGSFTGTTTGTGNFTKTGLGTLATSALGHTGLTTVSGGTLNVNGSVAGSVIINAGGTLSGNTAIAGNLNLNAGGTLSPGNSPGTTTVAGNFTGGGILNFEVQVNNAAAPLNGTTHDFLNITGNATGVSTLNMLPGGTPVLTSGKGIELVRVGGTTSPTAFGLSAPLVLDGITYALQFLPNQAGSSSFFLQSVLPDDLLGHATMLTAGRRMLARCHRGEERASAQGASKGVRSWAKYVTGSMKTGPDTGLHTDQTFSCGAGGIDTATGSDLRLGIVGGYGSTKVDVLTMAGRAKLDGDLGLIEAQASYVKNGMFLSLSAGYASTDWISDGLQPGIYAAAIDGMIGSLMAGHEWDLGWDLKVAVSGEISYDGTSCAMPCVLYSQELGSTHPTMAEENNWRAGLSAKVAGTSGAFRPFASVSWSDDIDGGSTVSRRAGVSTVADTAPNLVAARVGFEAEVSPNFGVFADVGVAGAVADPDKSVSGFDGQAGLRLSW